MGVLVPLLACILLLSAAPASTAAHVAAAEQATQAMAYWHTVLPNSPMPRAILDLLTSPPAAAAADDEHTKERKQIHQSSPRDGLTYYYGRPASVVGSNYYYGRPASAVSSNYYYERPSTTGEGHGMHKVDEFFLEEALRRGSMLTLEFPATTSRPALLPRHVADSVPFSSANIPDIVAMFHVGPDSTVADVVDVKTTLDFCEHPDQTTRFYGCATSLESLVEIAMAGLGTHDAQAFSSAMPRNGVPLQQYAVGSVSMLGESDGVGCHRLEYPYAVFYCHATGPVRIYKATGLVSKDGATALEAVSVCHLDTSRWHPKHAAFQMLHVKPGTVPVCHVFSGTDILWLRAAD